MTHACKSIITLLFTLITLPAWAGGWLGITVQPPEGVQIGEIVKDGPADNAGLKKSDILIKLDGKNITTTDQFLTIVSNTTPGKEILLTIIRSGDEREIKITPDDSLNHPSLFPSTQQLANTNLPNRRIWRRSEPWRYPTRTDPDPRQTEAFNPQLQPQPNYAVPIPAPGELPYNEELPSEPDEPAPTAWLGVAPELTPVGVTLTRIATGGPGEKAGLKTGDIIVSLNGQSIPTPRAMSKILRNYHPEDLIEVTIKRNGQLIDVQAQLATPPATTP